MKFMQLYNVDINPQRLDGKDNAPTLILSIPGKWGMFSHSYGCGQRIQCPLCTSARAFANFPFPWAPHMSHPPNMRRNNLELDEQQRSTMAVSAYQLMQDIFRWTCTAQNPPSNHVRYQLCRSGTCHNQLNTCKDQSTRFSKGCLEILMFHIASTV